LAAILTEEEKRTLLPALLALCSSGRFAGHAKGMILGMHHDWLIQEIEAASEPILASNDFLDWVNILEIYSKIDASLAGRLAQRMLAHSDPELREWASEFLSKHQECPEKPSIDKPSTLSPPLSARTFDYRRIKR